MNLMVMLMIVKTDFCVLRLAYKFKYLANDDDDDDDDDDNKLIINTYINYLIN